MTLNKDLKCQDLEGKVKMNFKFPQSLQVTHRVFTAHCFFFWF